MLVDYLGGVAAFEPMIEIVRTGQTGMQLAHGMSTFELLSHQPVLLQGFQAAMSERTAAFAPSVASSYDFSVLRSVADIGGGKGTLLAAILVEHPHLRGLLFDRPQVVAQAGGVLQTPALTGRCEIVGGDFFQGVPKGADAYVLANVLHDWDDAQAVRILAACRQAMSPRSRC